MVSPESIFDFAVGSSWTFWGSAPPQNICGDGTFCFCALQHSSPVPRVAMGTCCVARPTESLDFFFSGFILINSNLCVASSSSWLLYRMGQPRRFLLGTWAKKG